MRRQSGPAGPNNEALEVIKATEFHLEQLAKRIKRNEMNQTPEVVMSWTNNVKTLASGLQSAHNEVEITRSVLDDEIQKRQDNEDTPMNMNVDALKAIITSKVIASNRTAGEFLKMINVIFDGKKKSSSADDDDDDVEEVETAPTEESFKCPVTLQRMTQPMKKYVQHNIAFLRTFLTVFVPLFCSSKCSHHMSKAALDGLLRSNPHGAAKCVVHGCSAKWTNQSASLDTHFLREMERFYRVQGSRSQSKNDSAEVINDDEPSYTLVQ